MSSSTKKHNLWGSEVNLTLPFIPADSKMREMYEDTGGGASPANHGYFQTPQGKLHYRQFDPSSLNGSVEGKSGLKAVCVYQHGMGSHSGAVVNLKNKLPRNDASTNDDTSTYPYTNIGLLSRKLVSNQIALYALDMLGHGFSEGDRFYIPNRDYTINRDHLDSFARFVAKQHPGVPLFLMGEGYGGCLVLHVAKMWQINSGDPNANEDDAEEGTPPLIRPPKQFAGVCLNAPAIMGDLPPLPIKLLLQYIIAPLFPKRTPYCMPNPLTPKDAWRDPFIRDAHSSSEVKEMKLGPGVGPYCLGTAAAMVAAVETAQKDIIPGFEVPCSICHGTGDRVVKIEGTKFLIEHFRTNASTKDEDCQVRFVEGCYHDVLADPTREENVEFHIKFMLSRSSPGE
jgi:acylglycerol lipase